jgi:hypothetical protein
MSKHGHKLFFNDQGHAVCPESGISYILENGKVSVNETKNG